MAISAREMDRRLSELFISFLELASSRVDISNTTLWQDPAAIVTRLSDTGLVTTVRINLDDVRKGKVEVLS